MENEVINTVIELNLEIELNGICSNILVQLVDDFDGARMKHVFDDKNTSCTIHVCCKNVTVSSQFIEEINSTGEKMFPGNSIGQKNSFIAKVINAFAWLSIMILMCVVAGCGTAGDSDELAKQFVAKINAISDAIESGQPQETIDQLIRERNELGKRILKLGLSQSQQEAFDSRHKASIEAAEKRLLNVQEARKSQSKE